MTIQLIRHGYLLAQDESEFIEHSIVIQRYDGHITISQGTSEVILSEEHFTEFLRAVRDTAKVVP